MLPIEDEILRDRNLSARDKIVYSYMLMKSMCNGGVCDVPNETMQDELGMSLKEVRSAKERLIILKKIRKIGEKRTAKYEILIAQKGVKSSELIAQKGVKSSELIAQKGVKSSELIAQKGVKSSELIAQKGVKSSELIAQKGVKLSAQKYTQQKENEQLNIVFNEEKKEHLVENNPSSRACPCAINNNINIINKEEYKEERDSVVDYNVEYSNSHEENFVTVQETHERFREQLGGNTEMANTMRRLFGLDTDALLFLEEQFYLYIVADGTITKSYPDYRRHFINWTKLNAKRIIENGSRQSTRSNVGYGEESIREQQCWRELHDHYPELYEDLFKGNVPDGFDLIKPETWPEDRRTR